MENKENIKHPIQEIEDVTKYGEFISSYFAWIPLDKQKEIGKRLENITNKKES